MLRGLFLSSTLLIPAAAATAANDIGKIENSSGGAVVLREGKVLPTTAGTILQLNDIVRTERGGLLRLVLNDGSALMVSENTELRVALFDREQEQTLVEMLRGRIRAEVVPYTKPTGRFVMKTPTASVMALGTTVEVATSPATGTITAQQLENLPGLSVAQTALKVSLSIKMLKPETTSSLPAQPVGLQDIAPGANLGDYQGVGGTLVAGLDHFVVTSNANRNIPGTAFLLPGETTYVARDKAPGPPSAWDRHIAEAYFNSRKEEAQIPEIGLVGRLQDFDVNGRMCTPGVVVNGQPVAGTPNFQYKILGMGGSTGFNALQVKVTNQGSCPLYFFVPTGTGVRPKGFNKVGKAILGLAVGVITTDIKAFQDMNTFGLLTIVRPAGALGSGPAAPTGGEVTVPMRSYCVELHKLAPHPQTEYKFASEDDQKKFAGDLPVMQRAVQLYQTRQLPSTMGHGLDSIIQWTLWAKIEGMDEKKFIEEFTHLVHKNYEAKKQKWDKQAQQKVEASGQELWKLVQIVLK